MMQGSSVIYRFLLLFSFVGLLVHGFAPVSLLPRRLRALPVSTAEAEERSSNVDESSLTLAAGIVGLAAVVVNRLALTPALYDSQARSDIIAVIAAGGLILQGVYLLDLKPKEADSVTQIGDFVQEFGLTKKEALSGVRWMCESIITAHKSTASVLVCMNGQTLARVGVMGAEKEVGEAWEAPILAKARREGGHLFLPALQNLPGRVEFSYLPQNCQAALLIPFQESAGVVIIGSSRARSFTEKDIAWIQAICEQGVRLLRDS